MTLFKSLTLFLLLALTHFAVAQTSGERKAQELITALNKTQFVQEYRDYKAGIELDIAEFKLVESDFQERDVKRIQLYYNQSRTKFDAILDKLQADLTSRTMRKTIAQNPDRYTKALKSSLTTAVNFYNDNCKKRIEALTEKDSAMDVETIQGLFDGVLGLVELFKSKSESADELTVAYLESEFIQPLRLKKWEEIL